MEDVIIPIMVPAIFYVFLTAVILVPVFLHYHNKAASHRMISEALSRGQTVDPALIERLIPPAPPPNPRGIAFWFCVPGVIMTFIGIGLALAGALFPGNDHDSSGMLSGALIVGSMGLGFLVIAFIAFRIFKPRPRE